MSVSIIDGTIESSELRRTGPGIRMYKSIVFKTTTGDTKTVAKPISHSDLGPHLEPGTSGRFYLFSAIDHRGVHGYRNAAGVAVHNHPRNNERIGLVLAILGVAMLLLYIAVLDRISIWPLIMVVLGPILWITNRNVRLQGERQFNADGGTPPAIATPQGDATAAVSEPAAGA